MIEYEVRPTPVSMKSLWMSFRRQDWPLMR